jgi:hypothetical protein
MFHIDTSSKRSKLALRFFTYGVMTVSTIVITIVCMLLALGYSFDRQSLRFAQGGLVQVISTPPDAAVYIDDKLEPYRTPGKSNLAPGEHTVKIRKDGYRDWEKTVPLKAGQLLWLNYARLFPNDIVTTSVQDFDTLVGFKASPDRKWLMLQKATDKPEFVLADVQDETKPKLVNLAIPTDKYTQKEGATHLFSIVEWDLSSRFVLVRHQVTDVVEYLRVDRTNLAQTLNISQTLQLPIHDIHFAGDNPNILYVQTNDVLRRIDMNGNSISAALVTGMRSFTVYGPGVVAFAADRERTPGDPTSKYQFVGIFRQDKEITVRDYASTQSLLLDYAEYFDHGYLAITDTAGNTIDIIRDPAQAGSKDNRTFATVQMTQPATYLSFSDNGRMLLAQNGNNGTTYDLELGATYPFSVATKQPVTRPFAWIDDYYLWTGAGNTVKFFEFDGWNNREITTAEETMGVSLSGDNEHLLSISKNAAGKYQLQISRLILK